jgi:phthalate 4,5-dioxygenase
MLSEEKSKLLCDISPGAPMGEAMARFWLPVMRGARLEAGGFAIKFKLLCRDFVAFRGKSGEVAIFDERCPHRGCSLEIAHAQDDSLVCFFHGWKFHVSGKCIETPNESDPTFPSRVPLKAYPTHESAGIIWGYFGGGAPPPFPDLIFNHLPAEHVYPRVAVANYNWLTGLEAILDPAHVTLLHRDWVGAVPNKAANPSQDIEAMRNDAAPSIDFETTDYGFRYSASRSTGHGGTYLRVSEYVAPSGVMIPTTEPERRLMIISVPIDNYWSNQWYIWYSLDGPMPEHVRAYARGGTDSDDDDFYASLRGKPFYGQDRRAIRAGKSTTGLYDIMFEDFVAGEAQGAWPDRTKEFLGQADMAIMKARRYLLDQVSSSEQRQWAHGPNVEYASIQSLATQVQESVDWRQIADQARAKRAADLTSKSN